MSLNAAAAAAPQLNPPPVVFHRWWQRAAVHLGGEAKPWRDMVSVCRKFPLWDPDIAFRC